MPNHESALVRGLGRWDLTAIVINIVVGAGILGLPAKLFSLVGGYCVPGWVLSAVLMGFVAACFAEVGSRFTQTGGAYLYAYVTLGPAAGFVVGWLAWVSRVFAYATIANLALTYAGGFAPWVMEGLPRIAIILGVTALLTGIVVLGVRHAARVNNILTACKLVVLVGFVATCLPFVHLTLNPSFRVPSVGDWQAGLMLMTYAFGGIESAIITTGEMRNPRRDVPFALGVGLTALACLYLLIQLVCVGATPGLSSSQRPLVDAAEHVLGGWGGLAVNVGALITMVGTMFAIVLTGSRLPFALAEREQLPAFFRVVHPRFRTPYAAIIVTGLCSAAFSLSSSFLGALSISVVTRLVGYATTCAALIILRRRTNIAPAGFSVPGGNGVALLGLAGCVWLMFAVSANEWGGVASILALGVMLNIGHLWYRRSALTQG